MNNRRTAWQLPDSASARASASSKFGGCVPEPMAQRCLRGSSVQFARLATLAKTILIARLQAKAKVLLWLACEPLNLPRSGRIIALNVSDFEEALVDPRSAESLRPEFLR